MNINHHDQLNGFDFSSVISAAGSALKAAGPELVKAGIQKRVAEINAKRAQKIAAAQARQDAAMTPPEPVYLPATVRAAAPVPTAGAMGFFQTMPPWVIPAVIALVVAFLKMRKKK